MRRKIDCNHEDCAPVRERVIKRDGKKWFESKYKCKCGKTIIDKIPVT